MEWYVLKLSGAPKYMVFAMCVFIFASASISTVFLTYVVFEPFIRDTALDLKLPFRLLASRFMVRSHGSAKLGPVLLFSLNPSLELSLILVLTKENR